MHGVKQTQTLFIFFVKLALKYPVFAPLENSSVLEQGGRENKRSVTTFDWKKLAWKSSAILLDTSFV